MNKEYYIANRDDLNYCFQLYCSIKNLNPPNHWMGVISQKISIAKLLNFLDIHYKVTLVTKNSKLIKVF